MNYKTFSRSIETLATGAMVTINAINLSARAIDVLRSFIESGVLVPDRTVLAHSVVPEYIPEYMAGEYILPQMTYTKA